MRFNSPSRNSRPSSILSRSEIAHWKFREEHCFKPFNLDGPDRLIDGKPLGCSSALLTAMLVLDQAGGLAQYEEAARAGQHHSIAPPAARSLKLMPVEDLWRFLDRASDKDHHGPYPRSTPSTVSATSVDRPSLST